MAIFSAAKVASSCLFLVILLTSLDTAAPRRNNQPYVVNRWFSLPGYSETPYTPCDSDDGKILKVEVIPCETEGEACILKTGTNATIKITFGSKVESPKLKAVVHGILGTIPIPFHIPQGDACQKSGVQCPIEPKSNYDYVAQIPILKTYPKLSVKIKWELVDSNGKDVVCIIIPAKIR